MHKTTLLTYNLHYGDGICDVPSILKTHDPDLCCFQETDIDEDFFVVLKRLGYDMAGYSHSFQRLFHSSRYAIATFYNRDRYSFVNSHFYKLPRGVFEMAQVALGVKENSRTVLQTQLIHRQTKKPIYLYNVHLTAYSTNVARVKQIKRMGEILKKHETSPVLVAGDMNYPYRRKKLEKILAKYGLSEATHNLQYTSVQNYLNLFIMKVKLDYIFYKNIKHSKTERIQGCTSDHFPLYGEFSF